MTAMQTSAQSVRYIAESIATNTEHLYRDEDLAMTAPEHFGSFDTPEEARKALIATLLEISSYSYLRRSGDDMLYVKAARELLINDEITEVTPQSRTYRVRRIES